MTSPLTLPPMPSPQQEAKRLQALRRTGLLDSDREQAFDDIAQLASLICGAPVASVTLVDRDRQWFKASVGMDVRETSRAESICALAIRAPGQILQVDDVLDSGGALDMRPRDAGGALLRFYAGVPVLSPDGHALGTVCVLDHAPRALSDAQAEALRALGRQAERLIELRSFIAQREHETRTMTTARDDLQRRHDDLQRRASHDPLTGLLNRTALSQLRARPQAMARIESQPYVLGMVDIDHFKRVNDQHGHLVGDSALRMVADAISASIRTTDLAVRFGGEEFLLVFPETSLASAFQIADRLRVRVLEGGMSFPMSVSVGVAAGDPRSDTPEQVFERADQALYRAKAGGRNRVMADDTPRI